MNPNLSKIIKSNGIGEVLECNIFKGLCYFLGMKALSHIIILAITSFNNEMVSGNGNK